MNAKMARRVRIAAASASLLFFTAVGPTSLGGQDGKMQATTQSDRQQRLREQMDSLKNEYVQLVGKRDSTGALVIPYSHRQFPYNPDNPSMEAGLNGKLPGGFQTIIDSSGGSRKILVQATLFDHYLRPFKFIEGMLKSGEDYGAGKALEIVGDYVGRLKEHMNGAGKTSE